MSARSRSKARSVRTAGSTPKATGTTERLRATFIGGQNGPWRVLRMETVRGEPLESVGRIAMVGRYLASPPFQARWILHGVTGHDRYTTHAERLALFEQEPALGRPEATRAALIAIAKSEAWWSLAQDERRSIFEERSEHIRRGMRYLPAVAGRLFHGRDLGEPFDFLTWFEYAPRDAAAFEELVAQMRSSEEWRYVEREIDIRLEREDLETGQE